MGSSNSGTRKRGNANGGMKRTPILSLQASFCVDEASSLEYTTPLLVQEGDGEGEDGDGEEGGGREGDRTITMTAVPGPDSPEVTSEIEWIRRLLEQDDELKTKKKKKKKKKEKEKKRGSDEGGENEE